MEPAGIITISIAVLGVISGIIAHMRIRSSCHVGDVLSLSIDKEIDNQCKDNKDNKNNKDNLSSLSNSDNDTTI